MRNGSKMTIKLSLCCIILVTVIVSLCAVSSANGTTQVHSRRLPSQRSDIDEMQAALDELHSELSRLIEAHTIPQKI